MSLFIKLHFTFMNDSKYYFRSIKSPAMTTKYLFLNNLADKILGKILEFPAT